MTTTTAFTADTALAALSASGLDMRYVASRTAPVLSDDGLCLIVKTRSTGGLLKRLDHVGVGAYVEDERGRLVAIFVSTLEQYVEQHPPRQ